MTNVLREKLIEFDRSRSKDICRDGEVGYANPTHLTLKGIIDGRSCIQELWRLREEGIEIREPIITLTNQPRKNDPLKTLENFCQIESGLVVPIWLAEETGFEYEVFTRPIEGYGF